MPIDYSAAMPAHNHRGVRVTSGQTHLKISECEMTVHGVFPPPVTGMSLCTEAMATLIAQRIPVRRYNWSNNALSITAGFRVAKAARALTTPIKLLFGRRPKNGVLYMPCNAGFAAHFNILAMLAARLRGYRCVLHHHYYRYLDQFQWSIKLLTWNWAPTTCRSCCVLTWKADFETRTVDDCRSRSSPARFKCWPPHLSRNPFRPTSHYRK